jgi:hypothetical protein
LKQPWHSPVAEHAWRPFRATHGVAGEAWLISALNATANSEVRRRARGQSL